MSIIHTALQKAQTDHPTRPASSGPSLTLAQWAGIFVMSVSFLGFMGWIMTRPPVAVKVQHDQDPAEEIAVGIETAEQIPAPVAAPAPSIGPIARPDLSVQRAGAQARPSIDRTLNGIVWSERNALALIDDQVFRAGDQLPTGETVASINSEAVTLAKNGETQTLRIQE